ncbi:MAG: periplasmic heavy metal sensor [Beijerinckiaceae bacterium]|nr:periplasmic heavy metal sensor [Beijerinckiaceae bacterium]MCZ8300408.1 periplasmic heavy metal sensor [Beijerinckiaceae bacterium]
MKKFNLAFPGLLIVSWLAPATSALAQHQGHHQNPQHSSYSGFESRSIKALSDSQVADLKSGRGMGLALAAELNGYPGPMHVLELADKLALTPDQRSRMRDLVHAMKQETIRIGEEVIMAERALDGLFAENRTDAASLASAVKTVAEVQGRLRQAHLQYHLATKAALSPEQVRDYARLRGYASGP